LLPNRFCGSFVERQRTEGQMFSGLGAEMQTRAMRRAAEAQRRIVEAMADHRELNALQAVYRDWARPPEFVKRAGRWFAVVEYPPSVPRVKRRR
jgi:hypothetical protein